jgi:Mrp family chromosome partitioning ATPase
MSSNNTDLPAVISEEPLEVTELPQAAPVNPLAQAHALLRGRYWLAILLAIIGLGAGAVGGWYVQKPTYESNGLIRIKPSLPRVLYESDQNSVMPMFDSFVESQVSLLTNQRTIAYAMNNPDWKALGRGLAPKQVVEFTKSLAAEHPRGSELVQVTFTDVDPKAAQVGAAAVIDAYQQLYGGNDADSVQSRLNILAEKKSSLQSDLKKAIQRVADLAGTFGPAGLKQVYESKLQQMTSLSDQLQQSKLALALASGESATTQPAAKARKMLSPEMLALRVPEIGRLTGAKRELERQLAVDRAQLGDQHRTVLDEKSKLASIDEQLQQTTKLYQQLMMSEPDQVSSASPLTSGKSVAELQREAQSVQAMLTDVKKSVDDLGAQYASVQSAQADADDLKARLDETTRRIEQMNTEMGVGGRISVVTPDFPLEPAKDKRIAFASVGGLGMAALGFGFVLLLGLVDRRVRHISDVQSGRCNRILGVLPLLPAEDESDPEQAMIAAHGVHQIRMLLERPEEGAGKVIAITSASPGAGKTSLTLALGLSFAASGSRTLMIDCDIIGGGLSAKMKKGSRRRLGHVLRRLGLITTEQLVDALKESRKLHEPIGQTLIRQGVVTSADVEHAVDVQRDTLVGLREALNGDPANECITGAGSQNLFLMPLGSARRQHVSQLSFSALKRLIDQVSGWFDVVLIDTGPVLGSLEASLVASASDQVVLMVAKGEQRPLIDRAVQQLNNAGAHLSGIVLNRAADADMQASGFSSSTSRMSGQSTKHHLPELRAVHHEHLKLGPIGGAVIALGETTEEARTGQGAED